MSVHYASLTVNLDQRDKNGKPTLIKHPPGGIAFMVDGEIASLTLSVIENNVETELLTAPVYVEFGKPKQYIKVKHHGWHSSACF